MWHIGYRREEQKNMPKDPQTMFVGVGVGVCK